MSPKGALHNSAKKIKSTKGQHKGPLTVLPSYAELNKISEEKVSEWFHAKSTSDAYKWSVKEGKAWIVQWVNGMKATERLDDSIQADALACAFDIIREETRKALHAFVVYKCKIMETSYKTAEAVHSAFKHYFT